MTKEQMRKYMREYRAEGFGRIVDKRYYFNHREEILLKQRVRDRERANYRKKLRNTCEVAEKAVSLRPI